MLSTQLWWSHLTPWQLPEVETGNPFLWTKQLRPRKVNPLTHHAGDGGEPGFESRSVWILSLNPSCHANSTVMIQNYFYCIFSSLSCFHYSCLMRGKLVREVRHFACLSSLAITLLFLGLSPLSLESQRFQRSEGKCQEYWIHNWVKSEKNH